MAFGNAERKKKDSGRNGNSSAHVDREHVLTARIDDVYSLLSTSAFGLTSDRALELTELYGPNEVEKRKKRNAIVRFLVLFENPLVLILLVAGLIAGFLGDATDTIIIFIIVMVSTLLMFYLENEAQKAAETLRKRVSSTTNVLRDGDKKEVRFSEIVPGDIIRLSAGDMVPADSRVIGAKDFFVDQSAMTGESFPVEKKGGELKGEEVTGLTSWSNYMFMGTSVVSGTATAVVVATGAETEYGRIVSKTLEKRSETDFEKGLRQLGYLLMEVTFILVMFVFFILALLKHNVLTSLLFSVALAVGLTPELLPMILTLNLAKGGMSMAKKGVIVRHLPSIQNFGNMDVLCTDKTGTLTENKVSLHSTINGLGKADERVHKYAYLNSYYQTGLRSPLDNAILGHAMHEVKTFQKVDEIPFDFVRRRVSVVVDAGERLIITKGATEEVLKVCNRYDDQGQVMDLTKAATDSFAKQYVTLSAQGIRVLAVAYKKILVEKATYSVADERDMVFLGYVAFVDPVKVTAKASLKALRSAGVDVKVITGDNELVTKNVCESIGFEITRIITGNELVLMNDDALARIVEDANIFARITPGQKNRIIMALRNNGHVVGYIGDGINDAPSMRAADVSISVENAVDVAKETADIVLSRKSLGVLKDGVIEGRKTYGNTMKYVRMAISSNFGNMFSAAGGSIFLTFLPMLPTQVLLNNLMYDVSELSIPTDNVDKEYLSRPKRLDQHFIKEFMLYFGIMSSVFDFLTFFVLYFFLRANASLFQTGWFTESLCTQTFVIFVIRTRNVPFYKSRPSKTLTTVSLAIVAIALLLPFTPLGKAFDFVIPPPIFYMFLVIFTVVYLALVELMKTWFYKRHCETLDRCA